MRAVAPPTSLSEYPKKQLEIREQFSQLPYHAEGFGFQIPSQNPQNVIAQSCCRLFCSGSLFKERKISFLGGVLAHIAMSQPVDKRPQTLENMGCAVTEMLFKEASVLSIWQLFIIAVALRNNNSHDNCFSYIKMLPSLFPTTFCLSGMRVPTLLRP